MNNVQATSTDISNGKTPQWVLVAIVFILFIGSGLGLLKYQQLEADKLSQTEHSDVDELKKLILQQDDVINTNWLHTLNPLVKNVRGSMLWSSNLQQGITSFYNLPSLADGQQYRLWIYDLHAENNTPISALVFKPEFDNIITSFRTKTIVNKPLKFELVLEEKGVEQDFPLLFTQP